MREPASLRSMFATEFRTVQTTWMKACGVFVLLGAILQLKWNEFQCHDGYCIPYDCLSDNEVNCPGCEDEGQFRSTPGHAEANPSCGYLPFMCASDRSCIPESRVCNNFPHCIENENEGNFCPTNSPSISRTSVNLLPKNDNQPSQTRKLKLWMNGRTGVVSVHLNFNFTSSVS